MISLISTLLGFGTSLIPQLMKFWQDKRDKEHELNLLKLQMDAQKLAGAQKLEEVGILADVEESKALYESAKITLSGVRWVDATLTFLSGSVRPIITHSFFILYAWTKVEAYVIFKNVALIWTEDDMAIFCAIISFWFGSRSMQHFFKKR